MSERRLEPLTVARAEALATRTLAMIDADEAVIRRAACAVVTDRHDADRGRVGSDLDGLREVDRSVAQGELAPSVAGWLRATFSEGLVRTAALYGVKPEPA